jgi:hypothetical protein
MPLVNGDLAGLEVRDALRVDIGADHFVSRFGQTRAGDQTHVTATND